MTQVIASTHTKTSSGAACVSAERASPVQFGREICGCHSEASEREWLVTNRVGGFASGTISGILTRRYHGLLIAALKPPLGRTLGAASFLQPIVDHIRTHGQGTASEIFDGDAPFTPRGCIAQAWTVGELLRAWTAVASAADAVASNVQDKLAKKVVESFKEEPVKNTRGIRMQKYQDALDG